jgi:integrase
MAGLRLGKNKKTWMVFFRWDGRQYEFSTDLEDKERAQTKAQDIEDFRKLVLKKRMPIPDNVIDVPRWIATGGLEGFKQAPTGKTTGTIDDLIESYLETRRLRVGSKTYPLSHDSYQSDVYRLDAFKEFCHQEEKTRLAFAASAEALAKYKNGLVTSSTDGGISIKHKLRTVKALMLWAYDMELIESLPRNLRKYNDVVLPKPNPKFYTLEEVSALFKAANSRMKLWILLGLNCGYTQVDLSTLTPDMLAWGNPAISRDRNKTKVDSEHRLWPSTVALLQKHASAGPLLLTTQNGQPDGQPTKSDTVAHAFSELKKKVPVKLSFKNFRKTGANAIAEHFQDKQFLVELYLAHKEERMRKHYTQQHYEELHKATDWLGDHLGLKTAAID